MSTHVRVAVVNQTSRLDDVTLESGLAALQRQVSDHLDAAWGVDAELFELKPVQPQAGVYGLLLLDASSKGARTPPYAEATTHGLPLANVFLGDLGPQQDWTHPASRELLKLLVDPILSRVVYRQFDDTKDERVLVYLHDITAPCAGYDHGYRIGDWQVSDFVHPGWFQTGLTGRHRLLDQAQRIEAAFEVLPGERAFAYDLVNEMWVVSEVDKTTGAAQLTQGVPADLRAQRFVKFMTEPRLRLGDGPKHDGYPGGP